MMGTSVISRTLGGEWLGILFLIGAVLSGSAQFLAEMASDSYQVLGMAKWGLLPKVFTKTHSTYETPWPAILLSFLALLPVTLLELGDIVQIENTLYSLSLIVECVSAVVLRYKEPTLPRPYRIPLSAPLLALYLAFPVGLGIFSMGMCDALTWAVTSCVMIVGILLYLLIFVGKKYHWFTFEATVSLEHIVQNNNRSVDISEGSPLHHNRGDGISITNYGSTSPTKDE